jgi:hypothetical protein
MSATTAVIGSADKKIKQEEMTGMLARRAFISIEKGSSQQIKTS